MFPQVIEIGLQPAPQKSAAAAGLRYLLDDQPGITRVKKGKSFGYQSRDGRMLKDPADLGRIKSLAIPPAWTDVWISPAPNGHLQAVGRDARGRKQYRYHPRWREVRDDSKYLRMLDFAKCLPKIRAKISRDLKLSGLPREKVLAAVVRLLEISLIRVGNDEYAKTNNSYGLTTMQDRHADIKGSKLKFSFKGKSNKRHTVEIDDKRLARIVRNCQELPGQELFQYEDENGQVKDVNSSDVNDYLREITGKEFTAKDFRTWAGTVLAAMALQELEKFDTKAQAKRNVTQAIESVAARLGNTPTICKKCYVHPAIVNSYLDGSMLKTLKIRAERTLKEEVAQLKPEEAAVLAFLQKRIAQEAEPLEKSLARSLEQRARLNLRKVARSAPPGLENKDNLRRSRKIRARR